MDLTELILDIAKQGPLVGLLLYLMVRNQNTIDERNKVIDNLHAENKALLKEESAKNREALNNNTIALQAIVDSRK